MSAFDVPGLLKEQAKLRDLYRQMPSEAIVKRLEEIHALLLTQVGGIDTHI